MNDQNCTGILKDVKEELIRKTLAAYLSEEAPTRVSIAEKTEISATTVGKVFSALSSIGLAEEKRAIDKVTGRSCLQNTLSQNLVFAVIDLSSSIFTLSYFSGHRNCLLCLSHEYDGSVTLYENLKLFLSRSTKESRTLRCITSAVSVILADARFSVSDFGGLSTSLFMPTENDCGAITKMIEDVYGQAPIRFLESSKAFGLTLRYRTIGDHIKLPCAYIRFGRPTLAILGDEASISLTLRPSKLLDHNLLPLGQFGQEVKSLAEQNEYVMRTINLIDCAAEPKTYVIETDSFRYNGDMAQAVTHAFAATSSPLPEIVAGHGSPSVLCFGAYCDTALEYLCERLSTK